MVIHQSVLEDKSTRSELTIRNLCQGDVGRGMVYAQNIHNTIQCQFSVLSQVSNEEPAPVTDFRFNLKNRVRVQLPAHKLRYHFRNHNKLENPKLTFFYFRSRQKQ